MDPARRSALNGRLLGRAFVVASLALIAGLAWAYLWLVTAAMQRGDMSLMGLPSMSMGQAMSTAPVPWTATTFALMFAMWWIMMIGMMIPSALPMILLQNRVQRHHRGGGVAARLTALFTLGYLAAWAAFSLAATLLQWALHRSGLLSPMSLSVGDALGASLFAAAGLYQLSPLKHVCLRHCRSPAEFLATHRRAGGSGAFLTGAHHGLYCTGCCWLLMALLFAVGVMNLVWVATLAILILIEKLAPFGSRAARISGLIMLAASVWLVLPG